MYCLETNLLIFYLAGGFLVLLVWAGVLGEILLGANRPGVRRSVRLLTLVGMLHPAAALAAWDLVRLGLTTGEPDLDTSRPWQRATQAVLLTSVVATVGLGAGAVVR